jgi:transposase-like protein
VCLLQNTVGFPGSGSVYNRCRLAGARVCRGRREGVPRVGRVLTIFDEDTQVRVEARIEVGPGGSWVTHLHFDAIDGGSVTAEALRLAEVLGLRLPGVVAAPQAVPDALPEPVEQDPEPYPEPEPGEPVAVATARHGRRSKRPTDEVLLAAIAEVGARPRQLSQRFGVADQSVKNWMRDLRARKLLAPVPPSKAVPSDERLRERWERSGYNISECARQWAVGRHMVTAWLSAARARGVDLPPPRYGSGGKEGRQ